ncbi:MAG: CBS domain-containing protein [Steroidobacteraceae bacterium]
MNIGQIASKQVVTVPLSASLEEVAEAMLQCGIGAIVVTESVNGHAKVAGIITDRDIVRARLGRSSALSALHVADVMSRTPLVLDAEDSIANAIRHLQARCVRRAPVVDRDGRLLGLISTDDLLGEVAGELSGLAQIVAKQSRRRQA